MDESELNKKDYIPFVGLFKYGIRNSEILGEATDTFFDNFNLKNVKDYINTKHILERAGLLTLYNATILVGTIDAVNSGLNFLEKLIK